MSEPYIGEIRMIAFGFPPRAWAYCDGQTLAINTNQALFAILGTTYGGDGQTTFRLPDLRGRVPVHWGNQVSIGQRGGVETHPLTRNEMPAHTHQVTASTATAEVTSPAGAVWGTTSKPAYASGADTTLLPTALETVGSGQPHQNMPPFLAVNFVIALTGIWPSRP
jgi:microcystin-dependent protein